MLLTSYSTILLLLVVTTWAANELAAHKATYKAPVVVFPAYFFTVLEVTVKNQVVAPDCPSSGKFRYFFQNPNPSTEFSKLCQYKLLTLNYDRMTGLFTNQHGVRTEIVSFGRTQSAPFYEPMYQALESVGYKRNKNIRVAGYDSRLTPDLDDFVSRSKDLIENTYRNNGNRRVHLVGHSNGPLYAHYLLTHTTLFWRNKYIQGFTPLAGNFPGQGSNYAVLIWTGLDTQDFTFPPTVAEATASANMYLTAPSTYMSQADPAIFDSIEIIVRNAATGKNYTPAQYRRLYADANLPIARELANKYIGFIEFTRPRDFPYVDVFAEKGSGFETLVGLTLSNLIPGQVANLTGAFFRPDGDNNQEDITNEAVAVWENMRGFHFSLTDNPHVDHFALPSNPNVLARLIDHVTSIGTLEVVN